MPLQIIRQDITKMKVDAVVNAANNTLLGGGGVDGAIHRAAGPRLLEECRSIGGCRTGDAVITKGYSLPCRYIIHTVGPIWRGGGEGEAEILAACYERSLKLAAEHKLETVAFPMISTGVYGFPKDLALKTAVGAIGEFLLKHEMTVYLVIFDRDSLSIGERLFSDISEYIDDNYVDAHADSVSERRRRQRFCDEAAAGGATFRSLPSVPYASDDSECLAPTSLEDVLRKLDESFSEMLLRKIDEKGITDAQCYKKANIDRKLFSKIRNNPSYRPGKPTVLAFAIALELSLNETEDMLKKAGYALSHSNKFDVIVEYFIKSGNYNIFEINEALFAFDQTLLGA